MFFKQYFSKKLKALENPLFLSERFPWLYWRVYHFSWSDYHWIFNNKLAEASIYGSAAGYLLYLSDIILDEYGFTFITANTSPILGLDTREKLTLLYFGLLSIAAGRIIYLWRRPHSITRGPNLKEWVAFGLSEFTYSDFLSIHSDIRENGHRTRYGKYYDDDWNAFALDADWPLSGQPAEKWSRSGRQFDLESAKRESRTNVNFSEAKKRHESLLRSMLTDRYYENSATNKVGLVSALCFAIPGYFMFFLPNLDLFLTISYSFATR